MNVKSKICASLLALGIGAASIPSSQAGIVIGAIAGGWVGAGIGAGAGVASCFIIDAAIKRSVERNARAGEEEVAIVIGAMTFAAIDLVACTTAVVLDVDGNLKGDALQSALAARFPFVDDRAAIADLATLVRDEFAARGKIDLAQGTMVSIPKAKTRAALAATSLSGAQVERIAAELQ